MRARALALAAIAALSSAAGFAPKVFAQKADEPLLATASEWGGQGGVYTCAQWRAYVTRMYRLGDPRKRGYIEAKDFEIIKKASPVFQMATFDYFDMAGKGRVTQKEFIEFESPFFARFDRRHACRVTNDDIRAANTPTQTPTPQQRGGGNGGWAAGSAGGKGRSRESAGSPLEPPCPLRAICFNSREGGGSRPFSPILPGNFKTRPAKSRPNIGGSAATRQ
jgi:hypothetical protein